MYLLKATGSGYVILQEGDIAGLLTRLDELSEQYENEGAFLVNKECLGDKTYHYEFATFKGWDCALIIVGGIAEGIGRA